MANHGPLSRDNQIREIVKSGKDPVYFTRNYAKIQHQLRGLIPFETFPFQDDCMRDFEKHRFNIVLKSRQLGLSTITAAYAVWYAIFKKDKAILVIATKLSTAMNFIKKVKIILDNLPKWMLLTKFEAAKQQVSFSNGSSITAVPTSADAGRSEALALLIVDEAAFIRDFEDIWTGLYPTLSTGGSAILLSTPNGAGGMYYKLWTDAVAKVSDFNSICLPWHVHPEHDQAWFDKETKNLPKKKISQEFLCDFISSGDTFLQPDEMEYIRGLIEPPVRKDGPNHGIWIWDEPNASKKYVISADVARGDSGDFSTFHVIDAIDNEVVAEYMGKIPPDKLADLLFEYGNRYNTALICPERNTFGYFTCTKLRDMKYGRLYYKNHKGDMWEYTPDNPEMIPGFDTQSNTRPQILAKLEEVIRNRTVKVYSQRLYDQLQGFMWQGNRAQAMRDAHDDLVISLAIGMWLINSTVPTEKCDTSIAMALLKATSCGRRDQSSLPVDLSLRPVGTMNSQYDPRSSLRPREASQLRSMEANDFRWLLS